MLRSFKLLVKIDRHIVYYNPLARHTKPCKTTKHMRR